MSHPTLLLLNPIQMSDEELAGHVENLTRQGSAFTVVTGRADYLKWFPYEASWESWAQGAANRHARFVVLSPQGPDAVGEGAMTVVRSALAIDRPCAVWDGADGWWPLTRRPP